MRIQLSLLALLAPALVHAQATQPRITPADARARLYIIADDSMRGRAAGDIGNERATAYVAREFKRLGLEPLGDDGSYFESVPMEFASVDPHAQLATDNATLAYGTDFTIAVPLGLGPMPMRFVDIDGHQLIYGGSLGDPASLISPEQAADKVVIVGPAIVNGQRVVVTRPQAIISGRFSRSAAAFMAQYEKIDFDPRAGSSPARAKATNPVPAHPGGSMTISAAERLFGRPLSELHPGDTGPIVHGNIALVHTPTPYPARNVVGVIRGSDPKLANEYIVIGAHNDHVGIAGHAVDHDSVKAYNRFFRPLGANSTEPLPSTPERVAAFTRTLDSLRRVHKPRLDSIYNGADDDGSGTVALLEVAEAIATAHPRPKRSILFLSVTGEEAGTVGSRYFVEHPPVPLDSIVVELQMDHVSRGRAEDIQGGGPRFLALVGQGRLSAELPGVITTANGRQSQPFDFDLEFDAPHHPLQVYCRSDHWQFARFGIPSNLFFTGLHPDYHQVTDEPQYSDYDKLAHVAQLVHDVALDIANAPKRLAVTGPKPDPKVACQQ